MAPTDLPAQEKKQVAVIHEWLANQSASNEEVRQGIDTYLPELIRQDRRTPRFPARWPWADPGGAGEPQPRRQRGRPLCPQRSDENARRRPEWQGAKCQHAVPGLPVLREDQAGLSGIKNLPDKEKSTTTASPGASIPHWLPRRKWTPPRMRFAMRFTRPPRNGRASRANPRRPEKIMRGFYQA